MSNDVEYATPKPSVHQSDGPDSSTHVKEARRNRIDLADLTANNIGQLRKLNAVLFPVRFGEQWYKDVLKKDVRHICKFAFFNDIPVANICCRFEHVEDTVNSLQSPHVKVYIMTLGCLAPYRRLGIASKLLEHLLSVAGPGKNVVSALPLSDMQNGSTADEVSAKPQAKAGLLSTAIKDSNATRKDADGQVTRLVQSVYLHVQMGNDEARAFYEHHGFNVRQVIDDYYKVGVIPRSAWLLERQD